MPKFSLKQRPERQAANEDCFLLSALLLMILSVVSVPSVSVAETSENVSDSSSPDNGGGNLSEDKPFSDQPTANHRSMEKPSHDKDQTEYLQRDKSREQPGLFLFFNKQEQKVLAAKPGEHEFDDSLSNMAGSDAATELSTVSAEPVSRTQGQQATSKRLRYDGVLMRDGEMLGVWINGEKAVQKLDGKKIVTDIGNNSINPDGGMLISSTERTVILRPGQSAAVSADSVTLLKSPGDEASTGVEATASGEESTSVKEFTGGEGSIGVEASAGVEPKEDE